jgi:DNA-binding response OmpR family regulator
MKKVLLIDDDVDLLDALASALGYFGFEVKTSSYTDDIHSLITIYQPDILIIDYIMNGINGGEMCSAIKKKEATKNLPVIILSAYDKVIKSLGNYGCDAFISKPFDMQDLINNIKRVLYNPKVSVNLS